MPHRLENNGYKSLCPVCPFTAAAGRSDNIRRHTQLFHKVIPWDYQDINGFAMNPLTTTIGIKYNPTTGEYGTSGFCFNCGTHISCAMDNTTSKLATIKAHFCKPKQIRKQKLSAAVPVAPPASAS